MELKDAIYARHSVRGFTAEPVSQAAIHDVLTLAVRAISGENCQPWEFAVAAGDVLDALRQRNLECLRTGAVRDLTGEGFPDGSIYKDRGRTIGKALLGAMGITREDREGRIWWSERGYRFFDAPAVIYLLMDKALDETAYRFDMGCLTQNICLAAVEYGLGTCVEDQAIIYQQPARELLHIPDSKRFVVGIAIGHPDPAFRANSVVTPREDVDALTTWHGF